MELASYFPPGFSDTHMPPAPSGGRARFERELVESYGAQLKAMGEPSLWEMAPKAATAFRFTWLPWRDNPISIRVEERRRGEWWLVATRLTGVGWGTPGSVADHRERRLTAEEATRAWRAMDDAEHAPAQTDGGLDGAQWLMERMRGKQYLFLERWSPEVEDGQGAYRRACEVFVDLAGPGMVMRELY